jgi:arylsulfatase
MAGCSSDNENVTSQDEETIETSPVLVEQPVAETGPVDDRPNILLIVLDDVGYNDLSIFGSKINTPNIDTLANNGVLLTQYHTAPTCSPTRGMLLSGADNHVAGTGTMAQMQTPNQIGQPGYEAELNYRIAALPEVLKDAGYNTYMTGKWHLGMDPDTTPAGRSFDKSFAMMVGGGGAFSNMLDMFGPQKLPYTEDGEVVEQLPEDFYSTRFYTEQMIDYIDADKDSGKPFFAYLSHTAAHWPLQAPQETIALYQGKFDEGYDALRQTRFENAVRAGLVNDNAKLYPTLINEKSWDQLTDEEKRYESRTMETYAAMIHDADVYIGKIVDYLKQTDQYDNTIIMLMSDNGPEGHHFRDLTWRQECCDNSYENIGNQDSYVMLGPNWAMTANAPRRMYKSFTDLGGILVPAFFHYPRGIESGTRVAAPTHASDVMPTLLDMIGVEHPGPHKFRGRDVMPMTGYSLFPMLTGEVDDVRPDDAYLGWELFGKRSIRQGDWKINYIPYSDDRAEMIPSVRFNAWQLFNLVDDPGETTDLADRYPQKLAEMIVLWEDYENSNGVILPDQYVDY